MNKLGMSSVVAVALLLVIAVISVVGFQSWFNTFSTSTLSGVESQGSGDVIATGAKTVVGGQLYFNNGYNGALEVSRVTIGGNDCNFSGSLSNGLSNLSLSNNCTQNLSSSVSEVVVYTDKGIFSSKMKVGSVSSSSSSPSLASCLRNGTTVTSGSSSTFYSAFSVDYGSSCSGLLRNCTDGTFDGSDLFNYSSCSVGVQYLINHSLRFNDDDSAYLSWTPASTGNRTTWTWSGWVKRSSPSVNDFLFTSNAYTSQWGAFLMFTDSGLYFGNDNTNSGIGNYFASSAMVDVTNSSKWYHVVLNMDTTQAAQADRWALYLDGTKVTSFASTQYPNQNSALDMMRAGTIQRLGLARLTDIYADVYMTEVHFIDGQVLNASYFGENISGEWIPKEYTGSYGQNGFYLNFNNSNSLGDDVAYSNWIISNNTGTSIGDLTDLGGLVASFDGNLNQGGTDISRGTITNGAGNIGKDWGEGNTKNISGIRIFAPNDDGFIGSGSGTTTITLKGSNTGAFSGEETTLGTVDTNYIVGHVVSLNATTRGNYRYHKVFISGGGGTGYVRVAELQFFEGENAPKYWKLNNIDSTDSMFDNPTNNFATLDPSTLTDSAAVLQEGNLLFEGSGAGAPYPSIRATDLITIPIYFEVNYTGSPSNGFPYIGVINDSQIPGTGPAFFEADTWGARPQASEWRVFYEATEYTPANTVASATNQLLRVAYNVTSGNLWFGIDNTWLADSSGNVGNPDLGTYPTLTGVTADIVAIRTEDGTNTVQFNFGQGGQSGLTYYPSAGGYFVSEPPSGFKALSRRNVN